MSGGVYDKRITPKQARALGEWVHAGTIAAPVLLRFMEDGRLVVYQGDDMRVFAPDGTAIAERAVPSLDRLREIERNLAAERVAEARARDEAEGHWPEACGCGATQAAECTAAVEGYHTSLGDRSDAELVTLVEDGCKAADALRRVRARVTIYPHTAR